MLSQSHDTTVTTAQTPLETAVPPGESESGGESGPSHDNIRMMSIKKKKKTPSLRSLSQGPTLEDTRV